MATDLRASQYRQKRKALLSFATAEAQAYMIDSGPWRPWAPARARMSSLNAQYFGASEAHKGSLHLTCVNTQVEVKVQLPRGIVAIEDVLRDIEMLLLRGPARGKKQSHTQGQINTPAAQKGRRGVCGAQSWRATRLATTTKPSGPIQRWNSMSSAVHVTSGGQSPFSKHSKHLLLKCHD